MTEQSEIILNEVAAKRGKIGQIILNRPKALNALSLGMCKTIYDALGKWQTNDEICAVIIKSTSGRAFCAGGDIRALYHHSETDPIPPYQFFQQEYAMNARLYHFTKPYISFLDGITMGGGAGISIHGSHRIATERLMFAMPETGIGFFPDIGASEFLLKCPGKTGWYLALTGNIIAAHEAHALGLVNHVVPQARLAELEQALLNNSIQSARDVTAIIEQFQEQPGFSDLIEEQETLNLCFSQADPAIIVTFLREIGSEWARNTANMILSRSPTSVKVTFEQFKRAAGLSFDEKIRMDFNIAQHFLKGHDFREGIRAVVVEKDNRPRWQPATLGQVTADHVKKYFEPMDTQLKL